MPDSSTSAIVVIPAGGPLWAQNSAPTCPHDTRGTARVPPDDSLSHMLLQADHGAGMGKRWPPPSPPSLTHLSPNSVQRILDPHGDPKSQPHVQGVHWEHWAGLCPVLNPNPNPNPTLTSCASNSVLSGEIGNRRLMRSHILSYSLVVIPWAVHPFGSCLNPRLKPQIALLVVG